MKISREKVRENRERLVDLAADFVRERGLDGFSVADVSKAAGSTHGGFYNHFESKEALLAEAVQRAFHNMEEVRNQAPTLEAFVEGYLSDAARTAPAENCPAAALAGDVARAPARVKQVFADGFEGMVASVVANLPPPRQSRVDAIALLCRMVGAMVLARAMPSDGAAATEILHAARRATAEQFGHGLAGVASNRLGDRAKATRPGEPE